MCCGKCNCCEQSHKPATNDDVVEIQGVSLRLPACRIKNGDGAHDHWISGYYLIGLRHNGLYLVLNRHTRGFETAVQCEVVKK